jgi:hypothetical protein
LSVLDDIRGLVEMSGGLVVRGPEEFKHNQTCVIITCADLEDSQETLPSQEITVFNSKYIHVLSYIVKLL